MKYDVLMHRMAAIQIRVDGNLEQASVRLRPFYDPEGTKLRS